MGYFWETWNTVGWYYWYWKPFCPALWEMPSYPEAPNLRGFPGHKARYRYGRSLDYG